MCLHEINVSKIRVYPLGFSRILHNVFSILSKRRRRCSMQFAEWFLKGGFHQTRKLMSSKLAFHNTAMCFFDQDELWGSISGEGMLGQS
jgi:hypothetical protein